MPLPFRTAMPLLTGCAILALSACDRPIDMDMRGLFGDAPSTADAARNATAERPEPDARGIISYPGYQVAVARRDDSVSSLAERVGTDARELARFNGLQPDDRLREGEIIALPDRVSEPEGGPLQPPGVDIQTLAGNAIDEADADADAAETAEPDPAETATPEPEPQVGVEPVRHKVERGETAFTIARLYDVSIRSLAEWNGLDSNFTVREGQYLLIPIAEPGEETRPFDAAEVPETVPPGSGSPTPPPPSSTRPLPEEDTAPAAEAPETDAAPDLGEDQTAPASDARMAYPVRGDIIRDYAKGRNDGIDIAAEPGTPVKAAADGVVAAITEDTNGVPIIVLKHPDDLLTVYSNIGNVTVSKGDNVGRGDTLAEIRTEGTAALHFEVRDGFDSVDPTPYLE
ncbi:MAG: peptidoglycan DD-metalloendopeptidase family protein [Roseovarius sp.]|nr:peptidoglycan DD-metalloendopeptidase family protein [Roseovarius sp.]